MTDTDLKPCPFCGGDFQTWGSVRDGRRLGCSKCGASFTKYNGPPDNTAEDRLIAAWNTRAALQPRVKELEWHDKPDGQKQRIGRCGQIAYSVRYELGAWGYKRQGDGGHVISLMGSVDPFKDEDEAMHGADQDHKRRILSALDLAP